MTAQMAEAEAGFVREGGKLVKRQFGYTLMLDLTPTKARRFTTGGRYATQVIEPGQTSAPAIYHADFQAAMDYLLGRLVEIQDGMKGR